MFLDTVFYICVVQSITGPSCFKVNNWAKSKSITGPRTCSRCKNRGFRLFFCSVIIVCVCVCVFCVCPIICQFSKNNLFFQKKKRPQKLGFSSFCVLSLNFENYLFLGLLKHYKNRVSANCCVFCCCKRRKRQKKKITGISGFGFFGPKMAVS